MTMTVLDRIHSVSMGFVVQVIVIIYQNILPMLLKMFTKIYIDKHIMYQSFLDLAYVLSNNTFCAHDDRSFHTNVNPRAQDIAEEACSHLPGCGGLSDHNCQGEIFKWCYTGAIVGYQDKQVTPEDKQCVHHKTGTVLIQLLDAAPIYFFTVLK